jgi:hypothetical protein
MPYAQQAGAPRARTVLVMRLYQRMLATEMALGSDIMSNSVEGYQLLKLAGKSGSLDSLRKPLSVRFKSRRARGSRRTVSRRYKGSRQLLRKCIAKGPFGPLCFSDPR